MNMGNGEGAVGGEEGEEEEQELNEEESKWSLSLAVI